MFRHRRGLFLFSSPENFPRRLVCSCSSPRRRFRFRVAGYISSRRPRFVLVIGDDGYSRFPSKKIRLGSIGTVSRRCWLFPFSFQEYMARLKKEEFVGDVGCSRFPPTKISFGRLTSESSSAMVAVSVSLPRRYGSAQLASVGHRCRLFPFSSQEDVVRAVSGVGVGVLVVGAAWHVTGCAGHDFYLFTS